MYGYISCFYLFMKEIAPHLGNCILKNPNSELRTTIHIKASVLTSMDVSPTHKMPSQVLVCLPKDHEQGLYGCHISEIMRRTPNTT